MSQDAEQLRELIRKYEGRQRDLEERELQARDRLTMLETYMPAVLSWNAWSALQAQQVTPGEVTRIITGQQLLPMDESYTRRLQELENVVRGIKDSEELESVGPKASGSLTPDDIENMKKLQEIATNEMQLKRRIQSMERKELMYLAALQKADELRMRAEGITSGQEYTSPTIVEAGSSAEGLQKRVVELESEVNRLKKKAEVLEAENEKLLHMISDGTQEGDCQCSGGGLPEVQSMPQAASAPGAPAEAPAEAPAADEPPAGAEEAVAVQELQPAEAAEPVVTEAAAPEAPAAAEDEGDDVCQCSGGDEAPSAPPPEAAEAPAEAPAAEELPPPAEEPPPAAEGAEAAEEPQVVEAAEPVVTESAEPEAAEGGEAAAAEGGEPEAAEGGEPEAAAEGEPAAAEGGEPEAAAEGEPAAAEGGEPEAAPAEGGEAEAAPAEGGEAEAAEGGEAEAAEPVVTEAAEAPAEAAAAPKEAPAPQAGGAAPSCACPEPEPEPEPEPPSCKCAAPAGAPGAAAPAAAAAAPAGGAPAPPKPEVDAVDYGPRVDHITDCDTEFDEFQAVPEHITKAIAEEEAELYAKAFPPVMPVITRPPRPEIVEEPAAAPAASGEAPAGAAEAGAPAEGAAPGAPAAAPAAAGGDALDQLIEMTKALQAAFEHIRGCPSCSSTVGPTLEGIIDTLGRITSSLTAAHGGAPGGPPPAPGAGPGAAAPGAGADQDMFPSAPIGGEEECVPFNVTTSDPECGILCWRGSDEFVDSQGEPPQPREYATSDPNCTILCWDDISFEKVKPLAVKPPELESKGLEEGQLLTTVDLGAATTEPLSVSADIKVTSGPAVTATCCDAEEITDAPCECDDDCTCSSTKIVTLTREPGKQGPTAAVDEKVGQVKAGEPVVLGEQQIMDGGCACVGVCTCSTTEIEPVSPEKDVPASTGVTAVSPVQVTAEQPMAPGAAPLGKAVCSCSGVCTCCMQCIGAAPVAKDVTAGFAPIGKEAPLLKEKASDESLTESLYTRYSAEDFYFGEAGSFVLEISKICEFTDSELDLPFEASVESVQLGPSERLFMNEFPGTGGLPPSVAQPRAVTGAAPTQVTAGEPVVLGERVAGEGCQCSGVCRCSTTAIESVTRIPVLPGATGMAPSGPSPVQVTADEPMLLGEDNEECECSGVCSCSIPGIVPVGAQIPTGVSPVGKEIPSLKGKVSDESVTESVYTRISAEDFDFGKFGSYVLVEPPKICEFTDSELDLPFEEDAESVDLGPTERLFLDEFPPDRKPVVITGVRPQVAPKVPGETVPAGVEADEGYRIERTTSSTGELRDEIYFELLGRTMEPGTEQMVADVTNILVEPLKTIRKMEDEVRSEIPGMLAELLAKCEAGPDEKLDLAEVQQVLTELLAKCAAVDADKQAIMESVINDVMAKGGGLEAVDMQDILKDLIMKCETKVPGKLEMPHAGLAAEGKELPDVHAILSDVITKCGDKGKMEPFDIARILSEVITSQVAIQQEIAQKQPVCACSDPRKAGVSPEIQKGVKEGIAKQTFDFGGPVAAVSASDDSFQYNEDDYSRVTAEDFPFGETGSCVMEAPKGYCGFTDSELELPFEEEEPIVELGPNERLFQNEFTGEIRATPLKREVLPQEQQGVEQKPTCPCAARKLGVTPEISPVQQGAVEGIEKQTAPFAFGGPVAAVSASDDSFQYNEDDYSRVTAEDFPFGETGSCIMEPLKAYSGFTDSELELPFEEEEPLVELGPNERLFQNEFTGEITATPLKRELLPQAQQEGEKKRVCACKSSRKSVAPAVERPAEEQEEETFFEAIGDTLPQEKVIGETILSDERSEGEVEGDIDTQLASLRQRVAKKSKEIIELKTLLSQLQQNQSRMEGKLGLEPAQFPEMAMAPVGPGVQTSPSEMQAAIASLQDKCRVKDHMIGAMVEELRTRAQSGIWNELKTRIAAPEMPQPDYTRSQVVEYLAPEAQFPQSTPDSIAACACSGDAKDTSMALSLPPPKEERACVATPPLALQVPISTCTCPGDFKIVRKIGADSLLVGWQVPTSTSANIAGYDIYVNGVLQCKVWSGTRNRALLHCLDLSSPMVILLYGRTVSGQLSGPARITYPGGS